jgi:hypothetical protein
MLWALVVPSKFVQMGESAQCIDEKGQEVLIDIFGVHIT